MTSKPSQPLPVTPTVSKRRTALPKLKGISPPRLYIYFEAIIRHGSIRSAAESLRIASSALNRRVLDLEQEAGTVLFDRLPNGVKLTAAGEIFAAHVRRTLNDIRQVGEQIQERQGQFSGPIAIGSAESAALDILPNLIAEFQEQYPAARFTLAVGAPRDILSDLLEERVDFILTHQEPAHHDVTVLAAAKMPFCALMRADHPLSTKPKLFINECRDYPIVLAQEQLASRALVDATLTADPLKTQPVLVTNMFEVMKRYVKLTNAVSFHFYLAQLDRQTPEGLIAIPLADQQLAESRLILAARRGRVLPARAAAVCEWLKIRLQTSAR